jgi:transposase
VPVQSRGSSSSGGKRRKREELAQDIGRSRGGRTSKIHAVVDQDGRPRNFIIKGGQVYDSKVLEDLLDGALYKMRNIVERFFCTMKNMQKLVTRFEKLSRNFLAMVYIFAIRLWIN